MLVGFALCFVPFFCNASIDISSTARIYDVFDSSIVDFSLILILGSSIALIVDDLLYFLDMTYVSVGYQWSRRALILSIVLPYILMYEARYRDDLALYYCSFNASFLLQSYAIIDPLVAWERTSSLRYALFVISSLRLLTILGMNSYYFITVPGVFYMICFGLYAVLAGILIMLCLYYIYTQYHARDHELSVFFFSICVILNACVRLIVPLAFGSPFFHKFSHMEIFYIHIISIAIASIATIMPGRIARHNGILTKVSSSFHLK